jgi:hypothetical protein
MINIEEKTPVRNVLSEMNINLDKYSVAGT